MSVLSCPAAAVVEDEHQQAAAAQVPVNHRLVTLLRPVIGWFLFS